MRQPQYLKKGDTIGIVAPSMPIGKRHIKRMKNAVKKFESLGYKVEFSNSVFNKESELRSASGETRAKEFMEMYKRNDVKLLISIAGGEVMMEMLPFIDFEELKKLPPKYFLGYSDNTNMTYTLTTIADTMSIYGITFANFGMDKWHKSIEDLYKFLIGLNPEIKSYPKCEVEAINKEKGCELLGYNLTRRNTWKILSQDQTVDVSGISIAGCLDILTMLCGTKFDRTKEFVQKYKNEGIIWFLESCDLNVLSQYRALWQLKQAGWFENAKAIVIGRPLNKEKQFDMDYKQANYMPLKDLGVPVILDADFGHTNPKIHIVCGAKTRLRAEKGKAIINYELD